MSKYGVFPDPYFSVFSPNTGKYGPEKSPHLDTFHAVILKGMHFYWEIMNNITNNSAYFSKQAFWNHWPLNLHSRRFLFVRNFLSNGSFDQCQTNCLIVSTKFKIPLFQIKLSKKRSFLPWNPNLFINFILIKNTSNLMLKRIQKPVWH